MQWTTRQLQGQALIPPPPPLPLMIARDVDTILELKRPDVQTQNVVEAPTPYKPDYYCSSHMWEYLNPEQLKKRIDMAVRALKGHDFDSIAFRGMSGALIGPPVAMRLDKSMILVRKDADDTHSDFKVEGDLNARRYIILDDFSASGNTMRRIQKGVRDFAPQAECLGLLSVSYIGEEDFKQYAGALYPLREPYVGI